MAISIVERDANLGLTKSVVAGISEMCAQYGRVIVIEDDLILSPDFLDYMLQALDRYADDTRVYAVSAYMYPIRHRPSPDAFFLPLASGLGWGTWARAWAAYDVDCHDALEALRDDATRTRFNLGSRFRWAEGLEATVKGHVQTWDFQWYWSVFKNNGLVLHPRVSLTWNGGFDGSGEHSGTLPFDQDPYEAFLRPRLPSQLRWPEVEVDRHALRKIQLYSQRPSLIRRRLTHNNTVARRFWRVVARASQYSKGTQP